MQRKIVTTPLENTLRIRSLTHLGEAVLLNESQVVTACEIERDRAQTGQLDNPLVRGTEVVEVRDEIEGGSIGFRELTEDLKK